MSDQLFDDHAGRPKGPLDASAWDGRWVEGNTPWDMGQASPPMVAAVEAGRLIPPGRVLVPGSGGGHDARHLASVGFEVTGVDLSATAVAKAQARADEENVDATFHVADLFDLPPEMSAFDAVFEHTCFCAIAPSMRDDYVDAVADALRPGGHLLGVFFVFTTEEGPPFGSSEKELHARFSRRFTIDSAQWSQHSAERREGIEMVFRMTRNA